MNIIVRRSNALGDVILTTPVLAELRRRYPDAAIDVITHYPEVFKNTTFNAYPWLDHRLADMFVDLDLAYERRPGMHIVEAYMQEAFGEEHGVHLSFFQPELVFDHEQFRPWLENERYVVVHPAVAGWANRTLPRSTWNHVIARLRVECLYPMVIGTDRDLVDISGAAKWTGLTSIHEMAQLISHAACFVGSDTSLLHVAGCTQTSIVGVFTSADPLYRLPHRFGVLGLCCKAIMPDLNCVFCLHRREPPVTSEACERDGDRNACVRMVDPDAIVDAVLSFIH